MRLEAKDVFAVMLTVGDRNVDNKIDVTVEVDVRLPVFGEVELPAFTLNLPVDQVVGLLDIVVAALPPAIQAGAKGLLGILKGVLRH